MPEYLLARSFLLRLLARRMRTVHFGLTVLSMKDELGGARSKRFPKKGQKEIATPFYVICLALQIAASNRLCSSKPTVGVETN